MHHDEITLTAEEKARVTLQVDHFIDILSRRYGIEPQEVIDTVKWVRDRKELSSRFQVGAVLSLMGVLLGGLVLAMWEGVKHYVSER